MRERILMGQSRAFLCDGYSADGALLFGKSAKSILPVSMVKGPCFCSLEAGAREHTLPSSFQDAKDGVRLKVPILE